MKKIFILILLVVMILGLMGCNMQVVDLDYRFNYAIIFLPDGNRIEGEVTAWKDYDQSDMLQVKIDGITYFTHSSNVILESR